MKPYRWLSLLLLAACALPQAQAPQRKKLLVIGGSKGYLHDSTSFALATILRLGEDNNVWDAYLRTDTRLITKVSLPAPNGKKDDQYLELNRNAKNLNYFDAIFLDSTGETLDLNEEQKAALVSFVKDDGKGLIAAHSAIEPVADFPEYAEMIGGVFDQHPWTQEVGVQVLDRDFPATRQLPAHFTIKDEIYQFKDYSSEKVHELMKLDVSTVDLNARGVHRTDRDFAIAWEHRYGKGRVFYCSLGHFNEVWARPDIQRMWLEAIQWAMGITPDK
jgi:uncharacterized protein